MPNPEIDLVCPNCGGKTFTCKLRGNDRPVSVEHGGQTFLRGQHCSVTFTCTECRSWMSSSTTVPSMSRWGRDLQAEVDRMEREGKEPT